LFTQITLFTLKGRVITITCISNSAKRKVEISLAFSAQRHCSKSKGSGLFDAIKLSKTPDPFVTLLGARYRFISFPARVVLRGGFVVVYVIGIFGMDTDAILFLPSTRELLWHCLSLPASRWGTNRGFGSDRQRQRSNGPATATSMGRRART